MPNRKIIFIGETWLDIFFKDSQPTHSSIGGCIVKIAETFASKGITPILLTEIGNDSIGKKINAKLISLGVDTGYADLYASKTSIVLRPEGGEPSRYDLPGPDEGFDITWPRIEKEDLIVVGGHIAIDQRVRGRLWSFLTNCKDRKATIVYIPDVNDPRIQRITRVMPTIFENLEIADLVITLPGDLRTLYGHDDADRAFKNNLEFYCQGAICLAADEAGAISAKAFGNFTAPTLGQNGDPAQCIASILSAIPS
ncbi:MAG: hypothetical protein K2N91_09360 [Muribaculaceae bacterium]|nr:hypothetical protein [Muribaculaceae bacterium]